MNINCLTVLIGAVSLLTGQHAAADLTHPMNTDERHHLAEERDLRAVYYRGWVRMLEIPSYEAFFTPYQSCMAYTGIYVVEPRAAADGIEAFGRVVEVIRGPLREKVRLGPIAERLSGSRLVVYVDADGVPSDEYPIMRRIVRSGSLRRAILINDAMQPRELAAMGHGPSSPMSCFPHPEEHPRTLHTRAMVPFWTRLDIDVQEVFDLLSSEELPEVWAGCDMRLGDWPRESIEDWNRIGAFLSQALAVDGVVQRRLDRLPLRRTGDWIQDQLATEHFTLSGDMKSLGCYGGLLYVLQLALLTVRDEPSWRLDALRVLVDAASHENRSTRRHGCRIMGRGMDLQCDDDEVPNPSRLSRVRASLDMPAEPSKRTMWTDRDVHPARHLFPAGAGWMPDLTGEEAFPGEWEYFFSNLRMRGYAAETSLDGRMIAVPMDVDAPALELVLEPPRSMRSLEVLRRDGETRNRPKAQEEQEPAGIAPD